MAAKNKQITLAMIKYLIFYYIFYKMRFVKLNITFHFQKNPGNSHLPEKRLFFNFDLKYH